MARLTDEEIKKADEVDILALAQKLGLELKKEGKSYRVVGGGGLIVDSYYNKWNCFSARKGGGPIQLYMYVTGKSWRNSVLDIVEGMQNIGSYDKSVSYKQEKEDKELVLPTKAEKYSRMYAYLIKTRGIDKNVIDYFVKKGLMYESDEHYNIVFLGKNKDDEIKHATLHGTNTSRTFKGEATGSDKAYSFSFTGNTDKVIVFESPIDLLSYMTFHNTLDLPKQHHLLSLGGVTDTALEQYLQDYNINIIDLCLDNDKAGQMATEKINDKYSRIYKIETEIYSQKDYNEFLLKRENNILFEKQHIAQTEADFEEEEEMEL